METELSNKILATALSSGGTHVEVAEILKIIHSDSFKSISENGKTVLYQKNSGKWEKVSNLDLVRNILIEPLINYIGKTSESIQSPQGNDPDYEDKIRKYQTTLKGLSKLHEKCLNTSFRSGILKETIVSLYDPLFEKGLKASDMFQQFIKARVRRCAGWEEPPTFKDFLRTYRYWVNEQPNKKKFSEHELKLRLNELYQVPADGKTYLHIRLFLCDEEAEAYDQEIENTIE
jgi:hypothetical protein